MPNSFKVEVGTFSTSLPKNGPSVKTNRSYDIAVAYSDEYGRLSNLVKQTSVEDAKEGSSFSTAFSYKNRINLTAKINSTIAEGANLVTYLGHGSTTGTAVSVGKASDLDKIIFYFINGCSTGNVFTNTSMAEEFILEKQKGAIGWIGTSSEGVASYLSNLAFNVYQNSFKNNYGKSVAQNISTSIRSYQNQNDALNKIHSQQYIYVGDPSVSFYSPDKPDYEITSKDISILESNVNANSSNFNLSIIIKNKGKAVNNNVKVSVKRILGDNSEIEYPSQSFNNLFNDCEVVSLVSVFILYPNLSIMFCNDANFSTSGSS